MNPQKDDPNYTITQQKVYNYNNYTTLLIILFIIFVHIYIIMVMKKIN